LIGWAYHDAPLCRTCGAPLNGFLMGIADRQILPGAVRTNLPFDLAPVLMI
jgi:hypothetical protein